MVCCAQCVLRTRRAVVSRPDPVLQVLQRKAFRVRRAHQDDKRQQGSALLKMMIRLLDSKVGRK